MIARSPALTLAATALLALAGCDDMPDEGPIDEASVTRGAALVGQCKACHVLQRKRNLVGPHLVELYGRQVAVVEDYDYSEVLAAQDFRWTKALLAEFILSPTEAYPGTKMAYDGLSEENASDIAEYFRSRAD